MVTDLIFLCIIGVLGQYSLKQKDYSTLSLTLILGFLGRGLGANLIQVGSPLDSLLISSAQSWDTATSLVSLSFSILFINFGLWLYGVFRSQKVIVITAILPLSVLMFLLCLNVALFGDGTLGGPNQIALLLSAGVATLLALREGIPQISRQKLVPRCFSR